MAERHADLIFLGRLVREVENNSIEGRRVFSVAVLQRWKGPPLTKTANVSLYLESDFFLPNVSYLFFAKETEDGIWNVIPRPCSGTVLSLNAVADEYLKYLGEPVWESKSGDRAESTPANKPLQTDKSGYE